VELTSASAAIATALRTDILKGVRQAGERVLQDAVANTYGVSQTIVREAFSQLVAEGLLTAEPRRGVSVTALTPEDASELAELRSLLEVQALQWSIDALNEQQLSEAALILSNLDAAQEANQVLDLNAAFHDKLYEAAGRPRCLGLIVTLRRNFDRYFRFIADEPINLLQSTSEHQQLLKLCEERDIAEASRFLRAHILETGEVVCRCLRKLNVASA
jgi:DNA-binding GntR family transcriptional regulator